MSSCHVQWTQSSSTLGCICQTAKRSVYLLPRRAWVTTPSMLFSSVMENNGVFKYRRATVKHRWCEFFDVSCSNALNYAGKRWWSTPTKSCHSWNIVTFSPHLHQRPGNLVDFSQRDNMLPIKWSNWHHSCSQNSWSQMQCWSEDDGTHGLVVKLSEVDPNKKEWKDLMTNIQRLVLTSLWRHCPAC